MTGTITPIGVGTAPGYARLTSAGAPIDTLVDPGNTNAPIIFEPPAALSGGDIEVWVIAAGGADWGGCQVWISSDNATYALAGTIYKGGRQGTLTATLPSHSDPDTADTLSVDLSESLGQLLSGTSADADNHVTLCYCDGELLSYETATLTSSYHYDLTYLRRGAYGTPINSHSSGSNFARFGPSDPSLFRYRYPPNFVGQTIYVKLPAFNIFGQSLQDLAGLTADSYTLTGGGAAPLNVNFSYLGLTVDGNVDVPISFTGTPTAGSAILTHSFSSPATFPSGLTGSSCTAGTAATAITIFDIAVNGTNWGTMTFAASATIATFAGGPQAYTVGDVLTVTPRTTDATLANLTGAVVAQGPAPIARYTFDGAGTLPAGLTGSVVNAGTAATASTVFDIAVNGTNFATMTFAPGSATATFAGSAQSFIAGDVLTITPRTVDATLANISGYLATG